MFSHQQASFFVFVSHFYVIAATGYAAHQRRSIPAFLALYPADESSPLTLRASKGASSEQSVTNAVEGSEAIIPETATKSMDSETLEQPRSQEGHAMNA